MPLFWVRSNRKENVTPDQLAAARKDHLNWQFRGEAEGKLLGAGPLFYAPDQPPAAGMYILVCEDETEARAHADSDPFHLNGLREYELLRWRLNESSYLGVALRAKLNGDDPTNPHYWPPKD